MRKASSTALLSKSPFSQYDAREEAGRLGVLLEVLFLELLPPCTMGGAGTRFRSTLGAPDVVGGAGGPTLREDRGSLRRELESCPTCLLSASIFFAFSLTSFNKNCVFFRSLPREALLLGIPPDCAFGVETFCLGKFAWVEDVLLGFEEDEDGFCAGGGGGGGGACVCGRDVEARN